MLKTVMLSDLKTWLLAGVSGDAGASLPSTPAAAALNDTTKFYTPAGTYTWATLKAAFATFLVSLPTALPSAPGQLWNNGGTLAIS